MLTPLAFLGRGVHVYHPRMLRVVFAEDNYLVREGTVALLWSVDDVELVGTAEASTSCSPRSTSPAPDAVLTDIRMPPTNTDEGIGRPRRSAPSIPTSAWSCSPSSPTRSTPTTC